MMVVIDLTFGCPFSLAYPVSPTMVEQGASDQAITTTPTGTSTTISTPAPNTAATATATSTTTLPESEVITINVGGRLFTTKRSTISTLPDTFLASMFSGRWEGGLSKDENGRPFLDYTPALFDKLLSAFRAFTISPSSQWLSHLKAIEAHVPNDLRIEWDCMVDFLGVTAALDWRSSLTAGSKVDARDTDGRWLESLVLRKMNKTIAGLLLDSLRTAPCVLVHYLGWDHKWDEYLPLDSNRLAKLHTHTSDWRKEIVQGSSVEVSR